MSMSDRSMRTTVLITLIASALYVSATERASPAVKNLGGTLRGLLFERLGRDDRARSVLEGFAAKPEKWSPRLVSLIAEADAHSDVRILAVAQALIVLADPGAESREVQIIVAQALLAKLVALRGRDSVSGVASGSSLPGYGHAFWPPEYHPAPPGPDFDDD
jgi:hypothetical protein